MHVVVRMTTAVDVDACLVRIKLVQRQSSTETSAPSVFALDKLVALVPENSPVGTLVATPPLLNFGGRHFQFRTDSKHFSVEPDTAQIRTLVPLDYEGATKSHHLRIIANDTSRSTINVQVSGSCVREIASFFNDFR